MAIDPAVKVLVIDDVEIAAEVLKGQLQLIGFRNVDISHSGEDALARIEAGAEYGLFLCDWAMQEVDGLQVLQRVRSHDKLRAAPFIMVTGNRDSKDVVAAKWAGVSGYLVKPYDLGALRQRIESVFGR